MKTTNQTKRNWSQYNKKLVQDGRINFWFDEEYLQIWYHPIGSLKKLPGQHTDFSPF